MNKKNSRISVRVSKNLKSEFEEKFGKNVLSKFIREKISEAMSPHSDRKAVLYLPEEIMFRLKHNASCKEQSIHLTAGVIIQNYFEGEGER